MEIITFNLKAVAIKVGQKPNLAAFILIIFAPTNNFHWWAVVVAQLVERSLPIPEIRGSNPVIGKNLFIY